MQLSISASHWLPQVCSDKLLCTSEHSSSSNSRKRCTWPNHVAFSRFGREAAAMALPLEVSTTYLFKPILCTATVTSRPVSKQPTNARATCSCKNNAGSNQLPGTDARELAVPLQKRLSSKSTVQLAGSGLLAHSSCKARGSLETNQ